MRVWGGPFLGNSNPFEITKEGHLLTKEQIITIINKLELGFQLDPKTTAGDATLKSLGIDSLDKFNLLLELEAATGKKVPDSDIEKLSSIDEIEKYFS
jgi:acyl carrier protein